MAKELKARNLKNQFNRALLMKHHLENDTVTVQATPSCVTFVIIALVVAAVVMA